MMAKFFVLFLSLTSYCASCANRWSPEKAGSWYKSVGFLAGPNYVPRTAENTLEMWQILTFDPTTINQEFDWLKSAGMNTARVFLHYIPYILDDQPIGYLDRIDRLLQISANHSVGIVLVLLDDVWDPEARPGPQAPPIPHVHNSRWVQCPGMAILNNTDNVQDALVKTYVQGVINRFKNDTRVIAWDLYNEPGNLNTGSYNESATKLPLSLRLLKKVFAWARAVNPTQPLTSGVWRDNWNTAADLSPIERFQLDHSDVITYHNYGDLGAHSKVLSFLKKINPNRPHLCTEYMARPTGSTFQAILPYLKQQGVAGYNWGWVNGKTQTIYPWDSWKKHYYGPPNPWFHDVLHKNGTAYREDEIKLIRNLMPKSNPTTKSTTTKLNSASHDGRGYVFLLLLPVASRFFVRF